MQQQHSTLSGAAAAAAVVMMVLASHLPAAQAGPRKDLKGETMEEFSENCPTFEVGEGEALRRVSLVDKLIFLLKPNAPSLNMTILVDHTLYKATLDGTMVWLYGCTLPDATNCTELDSGGTKGKDYLFPGGWNRVIVWHVDNKIRVDIGMKSNAMGNLMTTTMGKGYAGEVTLLPARSPAPSVPYSASVMVYCNDTHTPNVQTDSPVQSSMVPSMTTPSADLPFPGCPVHYVEVDHPMPQVLLRGSLKLAMQPSHPLLYLRVMASHFYFKVSVEGTMVQLFKCDQLTNNCNVEDEGGAKSRDLIQAHQWNEITITHLEDNKVSVGINEKENVISMTMVDSKTEKDGISVAITTLDQTNSPMRDFYLVIVNEMCNATDQPTTPEGTTAEGTTAEGTTAEGTTAKGTTAEGTTADAVTTFTPLITKDSIIGNTTSTSHPEGSSQTVAIVIGVLVAALILVAIAVIVSSIRKRRLANINEHSRLQEQSFQQMRD